MLIYLLNSLLITYADVFRISSSDISIPLECIICIMISISTYFFIANIIAEATTMPHATYKNT